jgi:predicted acetyltransferase
MLSRSPEWWEIRRFWNPPWAKGQLMCVLVEIDGQPEAYALYRLDVDTEHMVFKTTMQVSEAIGPTPTGMREIWRFLLSVDLVETVKAIWLPPDHPLFLQLAEPRRMRWTAMEGLWLRLVDVGAALSARTYAEEGRLVFEVRDEFCPWNEGMWTLEGGEAAKSDDEPDLRLDAAALASVYLGGFTFADLAWAGRVEELQDGSLARGDAMFRTSRHPWCPEIF